MSRAKFKASQFSIAKHILGQVVDSSAENCVEEGGEDKREALEPPVAWEALNVE